jgi:hypothetical protein
MKMVCTTSLNESKTRTVLQRFLGLLHLTQYLSPTDIIDTPLVAPFVMSADRTTLFPQQN